MEIAARGRRRRPGESWRVSGLEKERPRLEKLVRRAGAAMLAVDQEQDAQKCAKQDTSDDCADDHVRPSTHAAGQQPCLVRGLVEEKSTDFDTRGTDDGLRHLGSAPWCPQRTDGCALSGVKDADPANAQHLGILDTQWWRAIAHFQRMIP